MPTSALRPVDPVDRAHLTGVSRPTPPIFRYQPSAAFEGLIERYWIPVWSLRAAQTQRTLQHPVCLVVISNTYARCYGVARGLSTVTLDGEGWAFGTMLAPAAGRLLLRRPVREFRDTHLDLARLTSVDGERLTAQVREAMTEAPTSPAAHARAIAALESALGVLTLDEQGRLINAVVAWLAEHPEVTRVGEVADAFAMTERTLQRLVLDRIGLSPKWLISRRRLHDAVLELKSGTTSLAGLAARLGYADQAHFTTDFKTVTGMTPGEYLADQAISRVSTQG